MPNLSQDAFICKTSPFELVFFLTPYGLFHANRREKRTFHDEVWRVVFPYRSRTPLMTVLWFPLRQTLLQVTLSAFYPPSCPPCFAFITGHLNSRTKGRKRISQITCSPRSSLAGAARRSTHLKKVTLINESSKSTSAFSRQTVDTELIAPTVISTISGLLIPPIVSVNESLIEQPILSCPAGGALR